METKSRLLKILYATEDILIFFDDYFKSTSWVYHGTGMSNSQLRRSKSYLNKKNILDKSFKIKEKPESILALITKPWDKKWRLVSFDIPEKQRLVRDNLRKQLKILGFKHFQRSVWVSPLPADKQLQSLVEEVDNRKYLSIFIGELFKQNSSKLAADLWEIDLWNQAANNLLSYLKNNQKENDKKTKKKFWDLILAHPKLPLDLLPADWPLEKLISKFKIHIKGKTV
jgi:CRISPR-associated endonuclease Cas2